MRNGSKDGVFPQLIGSAAFFDRVSLGVEGEFRTRRGGAVEVGQTIAIGGPGRPYARSARGICVQTGNRFELRYGKRRLFRNLPRFSLRFWSTERPLTAGEVKSVTDSFFCKKGFRARPMLVELTFDITNTTVDFLEKHHISRCRYERQLEDKAGRNTLYVGSPRSPVQVRIYDKQIGQVRIEYVFHSSYCRTHGLRRASDIGSIRSVELVKFIRFCERRARSPLGAELRDMPDGWRKEMVLHWPEHRPLGLWASMLRPWKVIPDHHLKDLALQNLIQKMQKKLVW